MILQFTGEIISVRRLTLKNQNKEDLLSVLLEIKDIHTEKIEEINYMTTNYNELRESVGKYISIPHAFTKLDNKAIFSVSEKFKYKILDLV